MTNTTIKQHHYRELLALGLPIIIGQLGTIVLGFADTLMIGHHSTEELAAAGLVNNIFALVLLFYLGFSYGLTPIVGQLFGKGKQDKIGCKVRNALVANLCVGLLLTLIMTLLYFNIDHIGQPEELLNLIRPYFLVNMSSILFVGMFNTLKQFFDGITHTKVAMWTMVAGNIINILFNWLLIYGIGPFPEWGLLGAGISTLGSRIFMALSLLVILFFKKSYQTYRHDLLKSKVNKADFRMLNQLGWPVALQLGMESAAFSLSCVMVGWLGTIPLAAHQIMITISQLIYLVLSGVASAMSIRVSHFMGQQDLVAVRNNAMDGFRLNLMVSLIFAIPILLLRNHIGSLFCSNIEVQHMVALLILVLALYQFGDGMQYSFANALRGIACVRPMVFYAFIAYFVVNLPLGYILGFTLNLGIYGIWIAFPFGLTIAGLLYWQRFEKELKKMRNV